MCGKCSKAALARLYETGPQIRFYKILPYINAIMLKLTGAHNMQHVFRNSVISGKQIKGRPYMNPEQLSYFRKILEDTRSGLKQDVARTVHLMQQEATAYADPNDRASQESDIALELHNRERERKLIKKITESIAKIDMGEYGYCDKCGIEIGLKRLEARPTATLCIDCKTLEEIKEKQQAG